MAQYTSEEVDGEDTRYPLPTGTKSKTDPFVGTPEFIGKDPRYADPSIPMTLGELDDKGQRVK